MTCPCDIRIFPPVYTIVPGLTDLPRQLAGFPEFREQMLSLIPQQPALAGWRARGDDDFGVMLLEMWAYVCDVVSFYDKLIADESYVRTAKLRPSVRKLVSLLGYIPLPAVAATVDLALLADGKTALSIAKGTALRSTAFGAEPPQVFEVDDDVAIYPAANKWKVKPPPGPSLSGTISSLQIEPSKSAIKDNDQILIDCGGSAVFLRKATLTSRIVDASGKTWIRVDFESSFTLSSPVPVSSIKLYKATRSAPLRTAVDSNEYKPFDDTSFDHTHFILDGVYKDIKHDDRILAQKSSEFRWGTVNIRDDALYTVIAASTFTVGSTTVNVPAAKSRFSLLHMAGHINTGYLTAWTTSDTANIIVHFNLVIAGIVGTSDSTTLADTEVPIQLIDVKQPSSGPPPASKFMLVDDETRGEEFGGSLDWTSGLLTPDPGTDWTPPLVLPVKAYGNVVAASRGETVPSETLGTGNGSAANQAFDLAKKPLTYLAAPSTETGVASTLKLWVGGVQWSEVSTFFGQEGDAKVYIIRQKDDGTSTVTFGDGVNGARLPTGALITATYRFGAGAATPPAGSITQLAKPVKGLKRVVNPIAAAGGADADSAEQIRTLAPRSALLLGRAISIQDMEAAAAAVSGVISAAAEWRWDGVRQRPVVQVWYIGGAGLEDTVSERLRAISDSTTPIDVDPATASSPILSIDVETDAAYIAEDVATAVRTALLDADTGLLANERIGVGKALFRSRVFEAVLAVPGAVGVRTLLWDSDVWTSFGKSPGAGYYFDFEVGNLLVTGSAT
jgi:hypothetical protein